MERLTLNITGMTCGHCVATVTRTLKNLDGVSLEQVRVGQATVTFDPGQISADRIAQAVTDAGYPVLTPTM